MIKNDKLYDFLKFIALVLLPALGTLYAGLAGLWGLPAAEQITGTVLAIDTFLGVVLHISASEYNGTAQGTINVEETATGGRIFNLELDGDPEYELEGKDRVIFRVQKSSPK